MDPVLSFYKMIYKRVCEQILRAIVREGCWQNLKLWEKKASEQISMAFIIPQYDNYDSAVTAHLMGQELEIAPYSTAAGEKTEGRHISGDSTQFWTGIWEHLVFPKSTKAELKMKVTYFPPKGWRRWEIWITFLPLAVHFTT